MRKRVLFAVFIAVLVAVFVLLPWLLGRNIEARYRELLAATVQSSGVSVQLEGYQRGWFTSIAILNMKVIDPGAQKLLGKLYYKDGHPLEEVTVTERILHGPFAYASWAGSTPVFRPVLAIVNSTAPAAQAGSPLAEMQLQSYVQLDVTGAVHSYLNIAPWHWVTEKKTHINWDGMRVDTTLPADLKNMRFSGRIGTLTISGADINVSMAGAHLHGDRHRDTLGQWLGQTHIALSNIGFGNAVNTLLSLHDVEMNSDTRNKGKWLDSQFVFDAAGGQAGSFAFSDARYGIKVSHLDENAIKVLQQRMRSIAGSGQKPLVEDYLPQIGALLKSHPVITLTPLHLASVDGDLNAQLEVHLAPVDVATADDLVTVFRKAETDVKLNISKALAVRLLSMMFSNHPGINVIEAEMLARKRLDQYVQSGVLKESTTTYSLKYHHNDNVTTLNGNPVGQRTGI